MSNSTWSYYTVKIDREQYMRLKARAKCHGDLAEMVRTYIEWGLENENIEKRATRRPKRELPVHDRCTHGAPHSCGECGRNGRYANAGWPE